MPDDTRIRFNAQITEEAAQWFVDFRAGDVDAAGRQAFDVWVRSSQEHLRAYIEVAAIWNEGGSLDAQRELDVNALISRAGENVIPFDLHSSEAADSRREWAVQAEESPEKAIWRLKRSRPFVVTACVALLTFATAALLWLQFHGSSTYATAVGEQRSIRLPDGSTIELNSRSRVRVLFAKVERAVDLLEGQALFQVAKDPGRPFVVRSDDTSVLAVGTQFDVHRKRSGTIVTVVEGKVAIMTKAAKSDPAGPQPTDSFSQSRGEGGGQSVSIAEPDAATLLSAGEQLTVGAHTALRPTRVDVAAATAWTQRQIILDSAPLAEVAEEFNRYSTRKLVVDDSRSEELRLSGVFSTDPDFLIRYLRARHDITVRETDREVRIVRQ